MNYPRLAAAFLAASCLAPSQDITGARIRAHLKFLAGDLLEGRGVATRGGDLATEYLATQLALAGAKPAGDNGAYFQKVPLVGVLTQPSATLRAGNLSFRWLDGFVGVSETQTDLASFDAEAIFVGHGINAPEFQWNDYAGIDVKGKVVVAFTNEPPSSDPRFFDGRALTYYGRWTYKYEEAARQGAVAMLLVHTTPTAGYGYEVVRNSRSAEDTQVKLAPGAPALAFAGWLTEDAGRKLLSSASKSLDDLLHAADQKGFRSVPLPLRIAGNIPSKIRPIETKNVVGIIPGSDPVARNEAVVFSAHWDHLGIGNPVDGDPIYNGAVDNASGCAILLEIARAWQSLPQKPRRSAIFVAVTAEETGLRGSEYYATHPVIPAAKTALNLNFDGLFPFGKTKDVVLTGAERSSFYPIVQDVTHRFEVSIKPDPRPEQGSYFRSDHFSFARLGIPAFSVNNGDQFWGKPEGYGERLFREYNSAHYHRPSDEYKPDWDFAGMEQIAKLGLVLGIEAANVEKIPR